MSECSVMLSSYVDWAARSDADDGQGGAVRTYLSTVRLRAKFAPVMPSASISASQLDSRTRGVVMCAPGTNAVHEGDRVTTPDTRVWEVKSIAPYTSIGLPIATADVLLLDVIEVQGE